MIQKLLWWYWLPVLLYCGLIFYFSSKTGAQVTLPTPDYIAHSAEYLLLGVLIARANHQSFPSWTLKQVIMWSIVLAVCYGISDEIHQSFVPGRMPDVRDVFSDFVGVVLGQIVWWVGVKKEWL